MESFAKREKAPRARRSWSLIGGAIVVAVLLGVGFLSWHARNIAIERSQ